MDFLPSRRARLPVPDLLAPMQQGLARRIRAPRVLALVALRAPRLPLAALLAFGPAAAILLVALVGPVRFAEALTETRNVHDAFARFLTAVATASAIAVSVATLTLRRDIRGISAHERRHETNDEFRDRVRERLGVEAMPIALGPFLGRLLRLAGERAEALRGRAPAAALEARRGGVRLGDHLGTFGARAKEMAARMEDTRGRPDRLLLTVLDQEHEVTRALLRRFTRAEEIPEETRRELEALDALLVDYILLSKYAKALDTEWGLSRMSGTILVSALPAVVTAALMVLTYGQGAVDALGRGGAAALVCAALGVVLFPLAAFVSYLMRFIFVNQHSLPTDGFLLGPEAPEAAEEVPSGGARGA